MQCVAVPRLSIHSISLFGEAGHAQGGGGHGLWTCWGLSVQGLQLEAPFLHHQSTTEHSWILEAGAEETQIPHPTPLVPPQPDLYSQKSQFLSTRIKTRMLELQHQCTAEEKKGDSKPFPVGLDISQDQ